MRLTEQKEEIDRFRRLVGQCAFIFKQAPGLVFQELHNRLACAARGNNALDQRLERARARYRSPWLRARSGDIDIPELLHILSGHTTAVLDCTFSADGSRLASAGSDGTLRVWAADTGEQTACFSRPGVMFWSCAFGPDGESIAALVGPEDEQPRELVLLSVGTNVVRDVAGVTASTLDVCPFNPAGGTLVAQDATGALRVIDVGSGEPLRILKGHTRRLLACAFSADGTRAASVAADSRLIVWDVREGGELRSGVCLRRSATTAAFSPDLDLVAVGYASGAMLLWDAEAGSPKVMRFAKGHDERLAACRFSPDGSLIVTHDCSLNTVIWDASTLRKIAALHDFSDCRPGSVNARGDRLVTAGCPPDYSAHVWNTRDGSQTTQLMAHTFEMEACAFSPDGRWVATAACDGTLMIWDVEAAEQRSLAAGPPASRIHIARFSPRGGVAAFASRPIVLLDRESGREVGRLPGHPDDTRGLSFSPDGRLLASTGMEDGLKASLTLWDVAAGRPIWSQTAETWTEGCRFSPDGRHVVWEQDYGTIVVVDAITGEESLRFERRVLGARESAFHPDGRLALLHKDERTLDVWDLDRGDKRTLVEGLPATATWSFSPDGLRLAVADGRTLFVCDVATGERLASVPDAGGPCRFSPDGLQLLTVELHRVGRFVEQLFSIRLREAARLELRKTIRFKSEMEGLVDGAFGFSPDGRRGYWASDERVLLFELATDGQWLFRHKASGMTTFDMSPDGLWIASGNARGDAFLFSLENVPDGS